MAWIVFAIGAGLTARGAATGNYSHIAFCALALAPIFLAVYRIAKARHHAKHEMVRRAFENERNERQNKAALDEEDRTAVVAHHIVLSYLEEVLETCVYGTSQAPMGHMHAYESKSTKEDNTETPYEIQERAEGNRKIVGSATGGGLEFEKPPAQILMSAARGLRGNTKRGGMNMMRTQNVCFSQIPTDLWCGLPVLRVGSRLRDISTFCAQSADVTMYKYGWHKDTDLRQAAVMKAETKLREAASPGHRWCFNVFIVALFNLFFIGARPFLLMQFIERLSPAVSVSANLFLV